MIANYLRENPYYIDTSPVTIAPPTFGKQFVKEIRWESFAAGNNLTVTTTSGGTLINETVGAGETDLGVMRFGPYGWVNSLVVTFTGTGNVSITCTKS